MEVILLETVYKLGQAGKIVKVKPGYGRNYLIPQKKALRATRENKEIYESKRAEIEAANIARLEEARMLAEQLTNLSVELLRQAGEDGKLFGSVTSRDIANAIEAKGIGAGKTVVKLDTPIKYLGVYTVNLSLHPEVVIKVEVTVNRSDANKNSSI
jgi:large subunit ribosomal protein L9